MHTTRYMIDDGSDTYADDAMLTKEQLISHMGWYRDEDPPRPFKIFAWDMAEARRDGSTRLVDVTEDMLWAAYLAGEIGRSMHEHLAAGVQVAA
jgi:hypothetical protein